MGRNNIKTQKHEIVDYWFSRVDECGLSIDATEAHERCWRCGYERSLERCHIVPSSLGGSNEPSNLVLLCKRCYLENPNVADPEIMWNWIRAYGTTFYDTFWTVQGIKEYEFIYQKSLEEEFEVRNINYDNNFEKIIKEEIRSTSYHYGEPYLNRATIAGVIRMALKRYEDV